MRHVCRLPLRWGDMDAQEHVNNVAWADLLQEARIDFLLRGPLAPMLGSGVLVASHRLEHSAPFAADREPLEVEVWVDEVGSARFGLTYLLRHHGRPVGRARSVLVPHDLTDDRFRRLTAHEREVLAAGLEPSEPWRPLPTGEGAALGDCSITVRWSDLDAYGHVNNVQVFEYAQQARVELLGEPSRRSSPTDPATGLPEPEQWVVVRQDAVYHRPIPHRLEPYTARTVLLGTGRTSATVAVTLLDEDAVRYATVTTVVVRTDLTGRPQPIGARFGARSDH